MCFHICWVAMKDLLDRYEAVTRELAALPAEERLGFSLAMARRLKADPLPGEHSWAFIVELEAEVERLRARPGFPVDPTEWEVSSTSRNVGFELEPPDGGGWLLLSAEPVVGQYGREVLAVWARRRKKETLTEWLERKDGPDAG